jgi:hypothetical protein
MKTECTIRNFIDGCLLDANPTDAFVYTIATIFIIAYVYVAIREML